MNLKTMGGDGSLCLNPTVIHVFFLWPHLRFESDGGMSP